MEFCPPLAQSDLDGHRTICATKNESDGSCDLQRYIANFWSRGHGVAETQTLKALEFGSRIAQLPIIGRFVAEELTHRVIVQDQMLRVSRSSIFLSYIFYSIVPEL